MAQSNVAREPSMDEILASIRKIIESNEPGLPGFNPGGAANRNFDDDGGDIHLTIDDADLVADFEAETRSSTPAPVVEPPSPQRVSAMAAEPAAQPTPALSLADVAARVRAASERHASVAPQRDMPQTPPIRAFEFPPLTSPQPQLASAQTTPPARAAAIPQPAYAQTASAGPATGTPATASAGVQKEQAAPAVQPVQVVPAAPVAEAAVVSHPVGDEPAPSVAAAVVSETATPVVREDKTEATPGPILSPEVGREVARSFDDLAHALDHSARRSFDEIAEDMLRPMLQEWLDDNLPTLVERLVREEIERVARGPRR